MHITVRSKERSFLYLPQNQNRLKAADYARLRDYLGDTGAAVDDGEDWRAGRLFVLPTTIIGEDRYMRQQMFDIIAISNKVAIRTSS